ncbi:MAG: hypothetical protein LBJ46_07425 [Planctomycetota bacterium]|jgi:hypothetical protein|nr:hypothetical protein [Planctomycetota bacterium]
MDARPATREDIVILRGKSWNLMVRWEEEPIVYKPISGIERSAPVRLVVPGHELPDGWRAAVVSVVGMREMNAAHDPPWVMDHHVATVIDADTIEFNSVNSSRFHPYVSGGYLRYLTPVELTGYTARMAIKTGFSGEELFRLTTENGGIVIDSAGCTINLRITAEDTETFLWRAGVYDVEMVSPVGEVSLLIAGRITVTPEVTT